MQFTTNNPGTDYDTTLDVQEGLSLVTLTDISGSSITDATQDCLSNSHRSCVTVSGSRLTPLSVYYLRVGGAASVVGQFNLSWSIVTRKYGSEE